MCKTSGNRQQMCRVSGLLITLSMQCVGLSETVNESLEVVFTAIGEYWSSGKGLDSRKLKEKNRQP